MFQSCNRVLSRLSLAVRANAMASEGKLFTTLNYDLHGPTTRRFSSTPPTDPSSRIFSKLADNTKRHRQLHGRWLVERGWARQTSQTTRLFLAHVAFAPTNSKWTAEVVAETAANSHTVSQLDHTKIGQGWLGMPQNIRSAVRRLADRPAP